MRVSFRFKKAWIFEKYALFDAIHGFMQSPLFDKTKTFQYPILAKKGERT